MESKPNWNKHLHRGSIKNVLEKRGINETWPHLFRASSATELANQLLSEGKDPYPILKDRYDWVRDDTIRLYIEMGRELRDRKLALDTLSKLD